MLVRVNGQTYSLMCVPGLENHEIRPAKVHRAEFTATHSLFHLKAGPVSVVLDFLSPVSPSNYIRQSLAFIARSANVYQRFLAFIPGYLTVRVSHARGHHIQIYSDIDGRWAGAEEHSVHVFNDRDGIAMHSLSVETAVEYTEANDMALWGQAVLASRPSKSTLSALSGDPKQFENNS